jgi:hypothetical protein
LSIWICRIQILEEWGRILILRLQFWFFNNLARGILYPLRIAPVLAAVIGP